MGNEEVVFKLRDAMRHSMESDDTCYALDVLDDLISNFVQDMWVNDELSKIFEDEDLPDELEGRNNGKGISSEQEGGLSFFEQKGSRQKKWWKNFSTNKKKKWSTFHS